MAGKIRIGTRSSLLAMWQARHIEVMLRRAAPDIKVELIEIQTVGDLIRDVPLVQLGGQGAFTKEIQHALQAERVDVAVHSLKDLPTFAVENLILAAVPPRGPIGDALVSVKYPSFDALPKGATIATSSLRRQAQIMHQRPDLKTVDIRGNVETRLRKLGEQNLDALILAEAGLRRLGLDAEITEVLDRTWMLPAVGQGALGLECRANDSTTKVILAKINDEQSRQCALAERAMLRGLGGGCQVPIGAATLVENGELFLRGVVLPPDGSRRIEDRIQGGIAGAETLGRKLARRLIEQGAGEILNIE